jgi:hypothetical protein
MVLNGFDPFGRNDEGNQPAMACSASEGFSIDEEILPAHRPSSLEENSLDTYATTN